MRTSDKRSPLSYIPGYSENAVLQLIVASATGFIIYHFIRVVLLVAGMDPSYFNIHFVPNLALQEVHGYASKFWVIFTYGWTHSGFWELFSNMVWLYAFGTIIQTLISYKQIIPLFVYSMIVGGLFYELSQLIPGADTSAYVIGAQAAIVGVATAAFTLSPKYRFYLASEFSIPIVLLYVIFLVLMFVSRGLSTPFLCMLAGGALTGFLYITLLKNGFQPGMWVYRMFDKLEDMATPNEEALRSKHNVKRNRVLHNITEREANARKIDEILDKINQKGYESLTKEEKETLLKASKEKDT
ncbi:MAG: hypothetical protein BGO70_07415 [Bacteroidetes bacterium 43-93]|nr:rhomboid family intramembrane serine protease [Bacteroidota bacterium]OJW97607.1 MAG: hypothetical protein BGO70_07415 [Bacteroidetes bacterium 43-93]